MTENVHPDGGRKDFPSYPRVTIPDLQRFMPLTPATDHASDSEKGSPPFSLYAPSHLENITYADTLMGRILPPYISRLVKVDLSSIKRYFFYEVPLGTEIGVTQITLPGTHPVSRSEARLSLEANSNDLFNEHLLPIGMKEFREHGKSVCGVVLLDEGQHDIDSPQLKIFAQPLTALPQSIQEGLATEHLIKRAALRSTVAIDTTIQHYMSHPILSAEGYASLQGEQVDERFRDRETRFDNTLLYPEIAAKSPLNAYHVDYHQQLELMYPNRLDGLNQGYVGLDSEYNFLLHEVPWILHTHPDIIEQNGKLFLPSLRSLYFLYQLDQAGFDVRLGESPEEA